MPSPSTRLFRTSTFRLAILYVLLFGSSVLVLLAFIYFTTVPVIERQTDDTIEAEIRGLAEQYRTRGLARLVTVIRERSGPYGDPDSLYLLVDPALRPLAGNMSGWPQEALRAEGQWIEVSARRAEDPVDTEREIRARTFVLSGGFRLMVGRDQRGRSAFEGTVVESLGWALAITLGLGLLGGVAMSRNMLRRVDAVRAAGEEIMRGDLTRRLPVSQTGDEFDRLAQTVNDMLDEIETLMTGLRTVTDSVAHDLRSPLTRLKSRLERAVAQAVAEGSAAHRAALDEAIAETDEILRTFTLLMEIARAEAGSAEIVMEPVPLDQIARDAAELYRPLAEAQGSTIDTTVAAETRVLGNAQFLAQLTANLLDNAVKFTPAGGRIAIAVSTDADGRALLSVDDSGPGIPEAERQTVLRRFVRLEQSRTTPGSGLGLSLVAGVATLHHAELTLGESALGGLRVSLVFPRTPLAH